MYVCMYVCMYVLNLHDSAKQPFLSRTKILRTLWQGKQDVVSLGEIKGTPRRTRWLQLLVFLVQCHEGEGQVSQA